MNYLALRNLSGPWDSRLTVRPNYLCWNFQDHPYLKAPIPKPETGTAFSCMKQFRWHARRTGGKTFTNFKLERGTYPQTGMKLYFVALPVNVDEFAEVGINRVRDPYVANYFPASVSLGNAPNLDGYTGVEVPEEGNGAVFDAAQYINHGFVGYLIRMAMAVDFDITGVGLLDGPEVHFSYQQL